MDAQRKPVRGEFLVYLETDAAAERQIFPSEDFVVERVPDLSSAYLARSKDAEAPEEVAVQRLRQAAGETCRIFPVLEDNEGHRLLPTGHINLLFEDALAETDLAAWLDHRGLALISRSKMRPSALTVSPVSPQERLELVVRRLREDPEVEFAEQDVLMRFQRE